MERWMEGRMSGRMDGKKDRKVGGWIDNVLELVSEFLVQSCFKMKE